MPTRLDHAQKANYGIELTGTAWLGYIADYVQDAPLETMRGTVSTSVGIDVEAKLSPDLTKRIQAGAGRA
ncbi:hypothetical protein APY03_5803 [Variovorax sp. WDL1]|nr:hypothetical protein APY03_5803 [Variovorax sp. WDL1]